MAVAKASFGLEALSKVRTIREALNDIAVGLLFGLDGDGKIVPADRTTGVKAIGIVNSGTEYAYGEAREFNKEDILKSGKSNDAEVFGIINLPNGTYTDAQIGNKVWLDTAGGFTLTEPTTIGELKQCVGKVYSKASVQINLTIDSEGETITASNFDVVRYSADGAIATSGFALVDGGTGISGLTLGAPTPQTYVEIRLDTLTSGTVVVTTGTGITYDGTNNTATFDATGEALRLGYKSATEWEIIENQNSVALSAV